MHTAVQLGKEIPPRAASLPHRPPLKPAAASKMASPPAPSLQAAADARCRRHRGGLPDVDGLVVRGGGKHGWVGRVPGHAVHRAAVALQLKQPLACRGREALPALYSFMSCRAGPALLALPTPAPVPLSTVASTGAPRSPAHPCAGGRRRRGTPRSRSTQSGRPGRPGRSAPQTGSACPAWHEEGGWADGGQWRTQVLLDASHTVHGELRRHWS